MDKMFLRTNFGLVSWFHKDFFISSVSLFEFLFKSDDCNNNVRNLQGKEHREKSLIRLTEHLAHVYVPCERTWIVLFPEGGFLHKRREISRSFSLKNNLPCLNHTTIPRVGAVQNIVTTLRTVKTFQNGNSNHCGKHLSSVQ